MKIFNATLLSACLMLVAGSGMAQDTMAKDAMKKDAMAADEMKKPAN